MMVRACRGKTGYRIALALAACCLLPGCGGKGGGDTPEAVAGKFVEAMKGGDTAAAAELFAYDQQARDGNEDWDTLAEQARNLIRQKMVEDKARVLEGFKDLVADDAEVGEAKIEGDEARVAVTGSAPFGLALVRERDAWRIRGVQ